MTISPTISTARLTLRHHVLEDFEPMAAHFATDWGQYMRGATDLTYRHIAEARL